MRSITFLVTYKWIDVTWKLLSWFWNIFRFHFQKLSINWKWITLGFSSFRYFCHYNALCWYVKIYQEIVHLVILFDFFALMRNYSLPVLAAWFRLKYPHIAIGALASSAPILHFDDITPRSSFYDAVSQDFKVPFLVSPFMFVCMSHMFACLWREFSWISFCSIFPF